MAEGEKPGMGGSEGEQDHHCFISSYIDSKNFSLEPRVMSTCDSSFHGSCLPGWVSGEMELTGALEDVPSPLPHCITL